MTSSLPNAFFNPPPDPDDEGDDDDSIFRNAALRAVTAAEYEEIQSKAELDIAFQHRDAAIYTDHSHRPTDEYSPSEEALNERHERAARWKEAEELQRNQQRRERARIQAEEIAEAHADAEADIETPEERAAERKAQAIREYDDILTELLEQLRARAKQDPVWYIAIDALYFAMECHPGERKDKITPEFHHQLAIVDYVLSLDEWLIDPVTTVICAFLHDTVEDNRTTLAEIQERFGERVASIVERLSKVQTVEVEENGERIKKEIKKDPEKYFGDIARCFVASIIKGIDRIHNLSTVDSLTLEGKPVMNAEKQRKQLVETKVGILPIVTGARVLFSQQAEAYRLIMQDLYLQMQRIRDNLKGLRNYHHSLRSAVEMSKVGCRPSSYQAPHPTKLSRSPAATAAAGFHAGPSQLSI